MMEELFARLAESDFRSRFRLKKTDFEYIQKKGMEKIEDHARDFVRKRLAPAVIPNDGKQTPMRGHPVFPAQHATACCCRGCLYKWHRFEPGKELTEEQQDYIVAVIMEWIRRQMDLNNIVCPIGNGSIAPKGVFVEKYESHRDIIDDYAMRGYKYVGFIPTKLSSTAFPMEIDLIFEKDIEEK